MTTTHSHSMPLVLMAALAALPGCSNGESERDRVGQLGSALNVCSATIDPELVVDGIPAYTQCPESEESAIYSSNGVDTATSPESSEWQRTQFAGGYQCTELIHRYWLFVWDVDWIPNGNAGTWCDSMPRSDSGIVQTTTPMHGDAIVFAPESCGADPTTGHVALVDTVDTERETVTFVEQNRAGRRSDDWSCAQCFLHVVANDGSNVPSIAPDGGAAVTGAASSSGTVPTEPEPAETTDDSGMLPPPTSSVPPIDEAAPTSSSLSSAPAASSAPASTAEPAPTSSTTAAPGAMSTTAVSPVPDAFDAAGRGGAPGTMAPAPSTSPASTSPGPAASEPETNTLDAAQPPASEAGCSLSRGGLASGGDSDNNVSPRALSALLFGVLLAARRRGRAQFLFTPNT